MRYFSLILFCAIILVGAGCKGSSTESDSLSNSPTSATQTRSTTSSSSSPCGDGVCDTAELADATLCPADCSENTATDQTSETDAVSDEDFSFIADAGIRIEDGSNSGVKQNSDGSISIVYQNRSEPYRGRYYTATASASSDWLEFTVDKSETDPAEFRAFRLPDGTCRSYGLDATKSGVLPGSTGLKSKSSTDCVNFTDDEGVRYELTDSDNGSMGVYDFFIDSKGGVVMIYLGDLHGTNNLRRAYSTDGGWTFTFQDDNVLGDLTAGGGAKSYVDNKVLKLADGRILMVAMKAGSIYTFLSNDDGVTWTKNDDVLSPEDFSDQDVTGLYDPQIIQLSDGRFRIYVTGSEGEIDLTDEANSTQNLYSATTSL